MKINVIVSLADSNYFELLNELIDSIKRFSESSSTAICILDAGLKENQLKILTSKKNNIFKYICKIPGSQKIPAFRLVLISKRIDNDNKINIIKKALSQTIDAVVIELLSILIQEDLIKELPNIIKRYNHITESESTVQSIDVMVAHDLNEDEKNKITQKLLNQFQHNPNINIIRDSQLVGGIKLKIGNKIFDNSISNQLKQLKRALHNM